MSTAFDEKIMRQLLALSMSEQGRTLPNPMVAAAVVQEGVIIATGVHQKSGEAHAEVLALAAAGNLSKGATVYVTLEPCTHMGKTPPCVDALIQAGVREVVFAMEDPNPQVQERSAEEALSNAGILVRKGICREEAREYNRVFVTNMTHNRPYITLKSAISKDMKIAEAPQKLTQITGPVANEDVHKLRRSCDGILVGIGTILIDNPRLNCRLTETESSQDNPRPIIIDPDLRLSEDALFWTIARRQVRPRTNDEPSSKPIIVTRNKHNSKQATVITWDSPDPISFEWIWKQLYSLGFCHILIEGGQGVTTELLSQGEWDEWVVYQSNQVLGPHGVDLIESSSVSWESISAMPVFKKEPMGTEMKTIYRNSLGVRKR
ncbi:bifunctional diaminohydroxyphosphoribosylaminopyrimidine deaminase/5-amino-6-(5-phosphoribosylamino)uracil reductase RibD [bacterium]|jgi:diaminohydroxyphosphoribosylaminopyrimidine deaminase / 5-amino-6-(5-phosphoribosylamino)uracil reductase|nr:bifunctional diaminohydroxyphosphoribosylaminopyrimidine deaminase/5-amino-6-(5-phosphoribosylamino)uracil reductase RibD [bacterium]